MSPLGAIAICRPRLIESTTTTAPNFSGSVMPPLFLSGIKLFFLLHPMKRAAIAKQTNAIDLFMVGEVR